MSPELQQRLITLAKAVAVIGVLVLGFLWLVSWLTSPADQGNVTQPNPVVAEAPQTPVPAVPETKPPDPGQVATTNPPGPVTQPVEPVVDTSTPEKDPGDEFYRMGLYPQALAYWAVHADKGSAKAAYRLGAEYMEGKEGVTPRDYPSAHKYFGIAAAKGDPRAQFDLGTLYDYGHGVERSAELAVEWYRKAAVRGHPQAQWTLAQKLEKGEGTPKNDVEALKWYYIAVDNGFRVAPVNSETAPEGTAPFAYEVLAGQLTKEQTEEARLQANDFRPLTD